MSTPSAPMAGRKRGARKSIAFQPSSSLSKPAIGENKENGGPRAALTKKSRSKSLGPGELLNAALEQKQEKVIKSILQPAIPISPLQQIPVFNSKASKIKALAPPILVPLKTEQEQQAARQQREAQRSAAMTHREKRRKSLGGRRVSFNPEVTMHVLEELRVSNTPPSIESNSTAKAPSTSARSAAAATPTPVNAETAGPSEGGDSSDLEHPTTPPKQVGQAAPEPESARLEHKKENRRPMTPVASFDHTEEFTGSPTPSSVFSSPAMTDDAESTLAPDDSSDEDDTGLISVVSPSVTARTDASDDDSDDMDVVDENEVTATFTPWIAREHNHPRLSHPETNFTSAPPRPQDANPEMPFSGRRHDHPRLSHPETGFSTAPKRPEIMQQESDDGDDATMEITRVVGKGVLSSPSPARGSHDLMDDDMTMEFTQAIGSGILNNRRLSTVSEGTDDGDMTMEFTRAIGPGLLSAKPQHISYPALPRLSPDEDDEQTMELTRAIGGIKTASSPDRESDAEDEDMSMELTNVIGGVLANRAHQAAEFETENTVSMDMDMTVAIGGIIEQARMAPNTIPEPQSPTINTDLSAVTMNIHPSLSTLVAEARARSASVTSTPPAVRASPRTRKSTTPQTSKVSTPKSTGRVLRPRTTTPQTEVPAQAEQPKASVPETLGQPEVSTPKATSDLAKTATIPKSAINTVLPKQTTPKPAAHIPKTITPKAATPRRSARTPQQITPTPRATALAGTGKVAVLDHGLSAKRRLAGVSSPGIHLTNMNAGVKSPSTKATGVGISKAGMGSPSVRRILSARKSIGASEVQPFSPGVRPLSQLLKDLNQDNKEPVDAEIEAARGAAGIKEMLVRMTPMKDGREKDPMSLERSARPKRTFDAVRGDLIAAASSTTTKDTEEGLTGSPARKKRKSLEDQPEVATEKPAVRFNVEARKPEPAKNDDPFTSMKPAAPAPEQANEAPEANMDVDGVDATTPNLAMKDFLGMIGISFMDGITSTRHRRQTGAILGLGMELPDEDIPIADQINGQLTIRPFLELYEHLQRELKRSNKEGKEMFKQIEKMVLEENPRLFREYVLAPPDVRSVMDLQFKNIKTSSRLEARRDWYTWRQGLQETLKAKTEENLAALKEDERILEKQRQIVDTLQPTLTARHRELEERAETLKARKEDIESCDPKELDEKRETLRASKKKLEEKKKELEEATKAAEQLETEVSAREARKAKCLSAIESAEKVAEANKGYTEEEVMASIERVRKLEEKTGWMLKHAESPFYLDMSYKGAVEVRFNAHDPNDAEHPARLALVNASAPSVQQKFFISAIEASCKDIKFEKYQDLLAHIAKRWDRAAVLIAEMEQVAGPYPNKTAVDGEELVFSADLLVMERKAKVRVGFRVQRDVLRDVDIRAEVIYGEAMGGWKLDEFLERVVRGEGTGWRAAMRSLGKQLEGNRK
ncbi:hypothetical protein DRE_06560 [Drechslerella stenobrocha 248]|uniref:Spc7 kinetochore protein domain-containing protein n=1 Tax=Drechslerella stenobrocha 248 TaxID=1043628 RepID=W7HNE2_9PEZI|nr:hypothetical protein DRE_06560 [Drechslerella stenobrocha 248]